MSEPFSIVDRLNKAYALDVDRIRKFCVEQGLYFVQDSKLRFSLLKYTGMYHSFPRSDYSENPKPTKERDWFTVGRADYVLKKVPWVQIQQWLQEHLPKHTMAEVTTV